MSKIDELKKLAEAATPGEWRWADWTIFEKDREAQRKKEPYWTMVDGHRVNLCAGDFGRKTMDPEYVIHGEGHEEWSISGEPADMDYIAAANPQTILKLLKEREMLRDALDLILQESAELMKWARAEEALADADELWDTSKHSAQSTGER